MKIQVDPNLMPIIREAYTHDIAYKMGHLKPDERQQLEIVLKEIDEEEARTARLFASGRITEAIWDSLWREWQDRRQQLRGTLATLQSQDHNHISNLDTALEIITTVGIVYNSLKRPQQQELLQHLVERVVINDKGSINLELRTPFSYLHDIALCQGKSMSAEEIAGDFESKTGEEFFTSSERAISSLTARSCGEDRIRTCGPLLHGQPLSRRPRSSTLAPPHV